MFLDVGLPALEAGRIRTMDWTKGRSGLDLVRACQVEPMTSTEFDMTPGIPESARRASFV